MCFFAGRLLFLTFVRVNNMNRQIIDFLCWISPIIGAALLMIMIIFVSRDYIERFLTWIYGHF